MFGICLKQTKLEKLVCLLLAFKFCHLKKITMSFGWFICAARTHGCNITPIIAFLMKIEGSNKDEIFFCVHRSGFDVQTKRPMQTKRICLLPQTVTLVACSTRSLLTNRCKRASFCVRVFAIKATTLFFS